MKYYVIHIIGGLSGAFVEAQAGPFDSKGEAELHISNLKQSVADCVLILEVDGTLVSCEAD
jgi:N-acetylmuramic acid 6-phosphate (MurNAc-6-P) etherase